MVHVSKRLRLGCGQKMSRDGTSAAYALHSFGDYPNQSEERMKKEKLGLGGLCTL